ncbi:MAG: response regulator transcription factor [Sulfuricella sp.]|nr:response regulator transcription factor [Sulfuricella sp.]
MLNILIADDHALVREGLKQVINASSDIRVGGEAANGWEMLEIIQKKSFHAALLDISMPGISGIDLIKRVRQEKPMLPILVLSMSNDGQTATRALKAGVSGYVTKGGDLDMLLAAIRKVACGGRYVEPELAEKMVLDFSLSNDVLPHEDLSEREFQVFQKLLAGKHLIEIAEELSLSAKTISTHKARLMRKLHVENNSDLIRYGVNHRLLDPHLAARG